MKQMRSILGLLLLACIAAAQGCADESPPYGIEPSLRLPAKRQEIWAVAPAINLSGERDVDPLLQADLAYQQLQQVRGVTVVPVNRVAEVYAGLRIEKVQSPEQAALVCDLLGCDALIVPTVTAYDPYNPPKFGGSLQMFRKPGSYARPQNIDPHELARSATPGETQSLPVNADFIQAVGMFDAANGSVRERVLNYASGRNDPKGPLGPKEYFVSMDRYCGFAYHELVADLLRKMEPKR